MSSMVWNFFEKPDSNVDFVSCPKCNAMLAFKGTTSGLKKHLKVKHFADYQRILLQKFQELVGTTNCEFVPPDLLLARSFCTGQIPFQFAQNPEFEMFCKSLNLDFKLPNSEQIRSILTLDASSFINNIANQLKTAQNWIMITDAFSRSNSESPYFFSVHVAFIDQFTLERKVLLCGVRYLQNSTDSEKVSEIQKTLEAVGLRIEECQGTVCDVAIDEEYCFPRVKNIACAGDVINRIFKDFAEINEPFSCLGSLDNWQDDINEIFDALLENEEAVDLARRLQKEYNVTTPLPDRQGTEWGAILSVFQSYQAHKVYFPLVPNLQYHLLNSEKDEKIGKLVELLQPLQTALDALTTDNTFSSDIVPHLLCVREELDENDDVAKMLGQLVQERIATYLSNDRILLAMISDPRYAYVPNLIEPKTWQDAEKLVAQHENPTSEVSNTLKRKLEGDDQTPRSSGLAGLLKRKIKNENAEKSLVSELLHYQALMSTNRPCHTSDPLQFWKEQQYNLPKLARIAIKNLTSLASTSPAERLFRNCSETIRQRDPRIETKDIELYLLTQALAPKIDRELLEEQNSSIQFDFTLPLEQIDQLDSIGAPEQHINQSFSEDMLQKVKMEELDNETTPPSTYDPILTSRKSPTPTHTPLPLLTGPFSTIPTSSFLPPKSVATSHTTKARTHFVAPPRVPPNMYSPSPVLRLDPNSNPPPTSTSRPIFFRDNRL